MVLWCTSSNLISNGWPDDLKNITYLAIVDSTRLQSVVVVGNLIYTNINNNYKWKYRFLWSMRL